MKMRKNKSGGGGGSSAASAVTATVLAAASSGDSATNSPASHVPAEVQIKEMLKELHQLICQVQVCNMYTCI